MISREHFPVDRYNVEKDQVYIGRKGDNDMILTDSSISGHHAKIVRVWNTVYIEDLNSTNGTLVNGRKVQKKALYDGDVITMGVYNIMLHTGEEVKPAQATDNTVVLDPELTQDSTAFAAGKVVMNRLSDFSAPLPVKTIMDPPQINQVRSAIDLPERTEKSEANRINVAPIHVDPTNPQAVAVERYVPTLTAQSAVATSASGDDSSQQLKQQRRVTKKNVPAQTVLSRVSKPLPAKANVLNSPDAMVASSVSGINFSFFTWFVVVITLAATIAGLVFWYVLI